MANVEFDDKTVGNKLDFFKWPQGISRGCILSAQAVMERYHFEGGYIKCTPGQDIWCKQNKESIERFGSWLCVYNTNQDGAPYEPLSCRIEPWAYAADKFGVLRLIKQNFGDLREHDILVTCTDYGFQKITIQGLPQAWWKANDAFMKVVVAMYQEKKRSFDLEKRLVKNIPLEEQLDYVNKKGKKGQQNQQGANVGFNPLAAVQGMVGQVGGAMPNFGTNPGVAAAAPQTAQTPLINPTETTDLDALLDTMKG